MATMRKFLFETEFDPAKRKAKAKPVREEKPVELEDAPPPPPMVLESEAKRMEQEAYQRGLAEGEAKGRSQGEAEGRAQAEQAHAAAIERQIAGALDAVGRNLHTLVTSHQDAMAISREEALRVVHAAMRAVHPVFSERHGPEEVAAVVVDTLDRLRDEPQASVRVSEKTAESLQDALDPVLDRLGFQGELILQVDAAMNDADVEVSWRGGSTRRSADAVNDAVLTAIAAAMPASGDDSVPGEDAGATES